MDQATVDYYKDTYGEIYQVGIIVTQITSGSAVERAGLQLGDKILKFNGFEIENANELNYLKEQCGIGQTATLTIDRDGTEMTLTFKLEGAQ
jgi:serine protease Do